MCSCNVLENNKNRVETWGLFQSVHGSTSLQAFLDMDTACHWALSTSQAAVCGCPQSTGKGVSSTGHVRPAGLTPVFHTCAHAGYFRGGAEQGPKSPQLVRASHFHSPGFQLRCLNSASRWEAWLRSGWLTGAWPLLVQLEYSLVLTKPCEIVASYLCSFFLKWNAQWWCQWLIITFCDWEYRFHCKVNANVNCSIFM